MYDSGSRLIVLRQREFRLFFVGHLASVVGSAMVPVALSFAVLGSGGSASDVGFVLAAQTAPLIVLLLFAGVIADSMPRRWVMIGADAGRFASESALAALLFAGHPPLWAIMSLAAVLGAGLAFSGPTQTGLVTELVTEDWRQSANALRGMADSLGFVIGPGVSGLIVATAGPSWAIALDAASFGVSALCLAQLHLPPFAKAVSESFATRLVGGWDEFRSHTWLWVIVLQWTFFLPLVLAPYMVLGAVESANVFGGSAAWGTILTVQGLGALAGDLYALNARPRRPMVVATVATMAWALPVACLALTLPLPVIAAAAFAAGAGMATFIALWVTTLQREVAPAALSRVSAYDWFGSNALQPVGYALVGPLSGALGVGGVLWLAAAWQVVSSLVVLAVPGVRNLRS